MGNKVKLDKLEPISEGMIDDLATIYKSVFAGHPWHEDFVCANKECEGYQLFYTAQTCERFDRGSSPTEYKNDCRNNYEERSDVFLIEDDLACPKCKMGLSAYYPDFRDHFGLIKEAMAKKAFTGFAGYLSGRTIGFAFGYQVPTEDTMTVAFSEVHKLLEAKGIDYRSAFYAAEIGVSSDYQGAGVGATLSAKRALEGPWSKNCEYVIARTKNSAVWAMYKKYFPSGQEYLFNDPVKTDSEWFVWRMSDFDHEKAQRVVDNGCIAAG